MNSERKLKYLAIPLTAKSEKLMYYRFDISCRIAGKLMKKGMKIFSPISHSYNIAKRVKLPHDWKFWRKYDKTFLSLSNELIVVMLDGWKESVGVQDEIKIAKQMKIKISYLNPYKFLKGEV